MVSDPLEEGGHVESRNPATGAVIWSGPATDPRAVAAAVGAAALAQGDWARRSLAERARVLRRFADRVDADAEELAALIVSEVGKLRHEAESEVAWTATTARWYADHPPNDEHAGTAVVRRRPVGVVAVVSPWNVPMITPSWKLLPALIAGNTVVWKPSELATGVAHALALHFHAAGVPADVLQVVPGGADTGRSLVAHPGVGAVHFTGSTAAGRQVAEAVAPRMIPCNLEMGGSNPAVVFADADLDHAADCIAATVGSLQGQKCTTTRRVLVEERAADALLHRLAARFEALVMGDPANPKTSLGPLITPNAAARARDAVDAAAARGAKVVARTPALSSGSVRPDGFFPATLLTDIDTGDDIWRNELFAPVVTTVSFTSAEQAWELANDTPYGLAAAVYTTSEDLQRTAAERIQTGVLTINARGDHAEIEPPFGGRKHSGHGAPEGGAYAYAGVTELQAIYGAA